MHFFMLWFTRLRMFLNAKRKVAAQGLVEYALILVLIMVVVAATLSLTGNAINQKLSNVSCQVGKAGVDPDPTNCP